MLKVFGLIFISLIFGSGVSIISAVLKSDFPAHYASSNSVEVLATILALNIATATFLIGGLLNIEEKVKSDVFEGARNEIRHNLYAMAFLFGLNIVLSAMVGKSSAKFFNSNITWSHVFSMLTIAILFFYVYLLMEIIGATFKIRVTKK